MKGLHLVLEAEPRYQNVENGKVRKGSWCSELAHALMGISKNKAASEHVEEKKYHHVPTHAARDFVRSATTPEMLDIMTESRRGSAASTSGPESPVETGRRPSVFDYY